MADQIVSCPGCQKKYKVGEGSPAGEFQCTQCGAAVAYGAAPAAPKAKPVQARGVAPGRAPGGRRGAPRAGPRGGARGPGRARGGYSRARGRGRARGGGRYAEEDETGYGPPPRDNTAVYILLGVIALLIVGGGIAFVVMSNGDEKEDRTDVVQNRNPEQGNPYAGSPQPEPREVHARVEPEEIDPIVDEPDQPGPGGASRPGLVRRPDGDSDNGSEAEPGPEPRRTEPRRTSPGNRRGFRRAPPQDSEIPDDPRGADILFLKRMTIDQFLKLDLPHLDDTTAEQKSQIDTACRYLVDYSAARKQTDAVGFLARIGRPAFPRVLGSFRNITSSWVETEGRVCVCLVDETLREIYGKRYPDSYQVKLSQMSNQSLEVLQENVRRWFVWWFSEGYKLESFDLEEEEEDEEDF